MFDTVKRQIFNMVTEPDNKTICPVRIAALVAITEWLTFVAMNYIQHGVFDAATFGAGFGALIVGTGAALGMKKDSTKE